MKKIINIEEIEIGNHGLVIEKGFNRGLLLPQVAVEQKWSREDFLDHTCIKAGLSPHVWKENDPDLYIFSADIFSEQHSF